MENSIRAVLVSGYLVVVTSLALSLGALHLSSNYTICVVNNTAEVGAAIEHEYIGVKDKEEILTALFDDTYSNYEYLLAAVEDYEKPEVNEVETDEIIIESVSMKSHGVWVDTEPVVLEMTAIDEVQNTTYDIPKWDIHERIDSINILWEFLVNQQGVSEKNASAIIGSICCEGDFGQKENRKKSIGSIQEARKLLGSGESGYGVVQWTYSARQKALLEYYELAYEQYPDDWDKTRIVAECCMLLEELKIYEVFDDLSDNSMSIEEAVGRLSKEYFKYEDYWKDWSGYSLVPGNSNGRARYNYAMSIYGYFTGN